MDTIMIVVHVVASVVLILIILLQIGKGASLSSLFGGGSSDAVFSGAGGDVFMKKLTLGFAIVFMLTSLGLTVLSSRLPSRTVMERVPQGTAPTGVPAEQQAAPEAEIPVPSEEGKPQEPFDVK